MELEQAKKLLIEAGFAVTAVETASRKGVDGDQRRVVRQRTLKNGAAELVWSLFKTGCTDNG